MRWLCAVGLLCSLGPPVALGASRGLPPAKGVFLVAKPTIDRGPFRHSVVLILSHNPIGTLGVIVNRVTEIPVSEVLPELPGDAQGHDLYFGGPVALEGLLFLYRSENPPEGADGVMGNVYYGGDREVLETLLENETGPDALHLFLGHSGWSPGQLDKELLRGDWDVVKADAFTVFMKDPNTMWEELSKDQRVIAFKQKKGTGTFSADR